MNDRRRPAGLGSTGRSIVQPSCCPSPHHDWQVANSIARLQTPNSKLQTPKNSPLAPREPFRASSPPTLPVPEPTSQNAEPKNGLAPPCPYLPPARPGIDWRTLHTFRDADRGAEFYGACLEYGQVQWSRCLAARALLCLDRAFGADLRGDEPVLADWPLPYAPTAWIIAHTPPDVFIGNPRVHFQHYADRMNAPRREQRQARAWACWALTRAVRPELPSDPKHRVHEPTPEEIAAALTKHGHPGEADLWREILVSLPDVIAGRWRR